MWAHVPDSYSLMPGLPAPPIWPLPSFSHLYKGGNSSTTHRATTGMEQALQMGVAGGVAQGHSVCAE